MKGASAVTALFVALLCVGCSDRGSPAGPSSVRADSLPANSAAGQAAGQGASVSPTPRRHGALQGDLRRFADDYATRAAPCVFGGLGNRHGDASRSVHARDTAHGELRDRDRRWDIHVHGGERRHADRRLHRESDTWARLSRSRSTRRSRVAQVDSRERRELSPPTGCSIRSTARPPVRSRGPFRRLVPESRETGEAAGARPSPRQCRRAGPHCGGDKHTERHQSFRRGQECTWVYGRAPRHQVSTEVETSSCPLDEREPCHHNQRDGEQDPTIPMRRWTDGRPAAISVTCARNTRSQATDTST